MQDQTIDDTVNFQIDQTFQNNSSGAIGVLCLNMCSLHPDCVWTAHVIVITRYIEPIPFSDHIMATPLPLDKMAAISHTTFWSAIPWMKSFVFW